MDKRNDFAWQLCAAALIVLLGVASYVFVHAAGTAYGRLNEEQETAYRLRVAAHYMTTRTRQSDTAGGVTVGTSPFGDCLVLVEDIEGETYETRVYLNGGWLRESFVPAGSPYDDATAFELVELDGFGVTLEGGVIRVTLTSGGETRVVAITPMSEGGGIGET